MDTVQLEATLAEQAATIEKLSAEREQYRRLYMELLERCALLERGIVADLSIVHAWMSDTEGNLVYRKTARNFNPMMATAGKVTVAEVEHLVQPGDLNPDHIITPGVYVKRIVHVPNAVKHIEQRTVRKRVAAAGTGEEV